MTPSNYSWIDPHLAGSAQPYHIDAIEVFKEDGVTDLISLTPKKPLVSKYMDTSIKLHHYPVYATPDEAQLSDFIELMKEIQKENRKAVVHCQYGQERTGIFLAVYLIEIKNMNVREAIKFIRDKRPSSLRTDHAVKYLLDKYD